MSRGVKNTVVEGRGEMAIILDVLQIVVRVRKMEEMCLCDRSSSYVESDVAQS